LADFHEILCKHHAIRDHHALILVIPNHVYNANMMPEQTFDEMV